jgi:hypothetical protein
MAGAKPRLSKARYLDSGASVVTRLEYEDGLMSHRHAEDEGD